MKSFWQSVAWVADTVLTTCWPLEQEPSMADLEREAVLGGDGTDDVWPDKEAEEEPPLLSTKPGGSFWAYEDGAMQALRDTAWPWGAAYDGWPNAERARHKEPPLTDDELVALRQLIEERFGEPASAGPSAAVGPEPVVPPTGSGHPNLDRNELLITCWALRETADRQTNPKNHAVFASLADRLDPSK